jgi:hypothetical protein
MLSAAISEVHAAAATTSMYLPGPATTNGPCIRLIGELRSISAEDDWADPAHLDAVARTVNELVHRLHNLTDGVGRRDGHHHSIVQLAAVARAMNELGVHLDEVYARLIKLAARMRRAEQATLEDAADLLFGAVAILRGAHALRDHCSVSPR